MADYEVKNRTIGFGKKKKIARDLYVDGVVVETNLKPDRDAMAEVIQYGEPNDTYCDADITEPLSVAGIKALMAAKAALVEAQK